MRYMVRVLPLVGGVFALWRMLAGHHNRPDLPHPETLILHVDNQDRRVAIASIPNLRDIGGYRTRDGQRVRWGLVYRSGSLATTTNEDLAKLRQLRLRYVCDLRTEDERAKAPDRLPESVRYEHVQTQNVNNQQHHLLGMLLKPHYLHVMLREVYVEVIIAQNAAMFKTVLERIADPANLPLLIHCTAGKDRTGLAIALLLALLGVDDEAIIADYSQSNSAFMAIKEASKDIIQRLQRVGLSEKDTDALFLAHPDTLRYALAALRERYGSVEAYARDACKITPETIACLRANLLETAAENV